MYIPDDLIEFKTDNIGSIFSAADSLSKLLVDSLLRNFKFGSFVIKYAIIMDDIGETISLSIISTSVIVSTNKALIAST